MARGKQTCKILKEIRRQIAEANDIEFVTSDCRYKGDCLGTCPKCEAEVRYLEQQLRKRQLMGKAVAIAGISAGLIAFSGCGSSDKPQSGFEDGTLLGEPTEVLEDDFEWFDEGELPTEEVVDSIRAAAMKVINADKAPISYTNQEQESTGIKTVKCPSTFNQTEESASTKKDKEQKIYAVVGEVAETQPEFPGGSEAMYQFIVENLKYPSTCENIQGRAIVQFLVDDTGHVHSPEIAKSDFSESFNQEIIRIVNLFPQFKPGEKDGLPATMWTAIPIVFRSENTDKP